MFTGIVEATATVAEVTPAAAGMRIRLETALAASLHPGASLGVNGVCLTVVVVDGAHVVADIGPETARVTTLGGLRPGQPVNLERPMRLDGRLDGHFVLGHVDDVGVVAAIRGQADSTWVTIGYPRALARFLIPKGSVAVDGISLTIAGLGAETFDVQVIPFTWMHTTLRHIRPDDKVNLECDMIGKYVVRALDARQT